jgi:hypothetical protein
VVGGGEREKEGLRREGEGVPEHTPISFKHIKAANTQ